MVVILSITDDIVTFMPKRLNKESLEQALGLLAEKMEFEQASPVSMVVCGGSSLIATGLVNRTTKDVDVLALMNSAGELITSEPLPEAVVHAAAEIAAQLGLEPKWLNGGPADLLRWGLPQGFRARLTERNYGPCLTVWFIGRLDQIHFKIFAATDAGPGRHVSDLLALQPTEVELLAGAKWSLTQDSSEGFALTLRDMMKQLGYEKIAGQI